jgi:hypothetical protein
VLKMSARELGDPMPLGILMKSCDRLLHQISIGTLEPVFALSSTTCVS